MKKYVKAMTENEVERIILNSNLLKFKDLKNNFFFECNELEEEKKSGYLNYKGVLNYRKVKNGKFYQKKLKGFVSPSGRVYLKFDDNYISNEY